MGCSMSVAGKTFFILTLVAAMGAPLQKAAAEFLSTALRSRVC